MVDSSELQAYYLMAGNQRVNKTIGFCGCSYTYGTGVEEYERYSSLVLDQLDAIGINLARRGASNTDIFHQALELVNDVDYLVVQWSAGGRGD